MKLKLNGNILEIVKDSNNKFGIEQLKHVAEMVANEWKLIAGRLKDGKMTWLEGILTGTELISVGKEIIAELQDLKSELQDLTEAEIEQLVQYVSKVSGLADEKAGKFVETVLIETIDVILSIVSIFKTAKEVF